MFEQHQIYRWIGAFLVTTVVHLGADAQTEEPHALYAAVWHAEADPAVLVHSNHPPGFAAQAGHRLTDIEVWLEAGARKYLGVFRPAADDVHALAGPLSQADFDQERTIQQSAGRCLTGFEMWSENDLTWYAGVFAPDPLASDCTGIIFEAGLDVVEFNAKLQDHGANHHLVDFETVVEGGQLRLSGLWQPGAEATQIYALLGASWETFHESSHDLTAQGYRLIDLDIQFGAKTPGVEAEEPTAPGRVARHASAGEDTDRRMLSGVWREAVGMNWLAVDFHWNQLSCAHARLGLGFEDSGLVTKLVDSVTVHTTTCEENGGAGLVPQPGQEMPLVTIDVYPKPVYHNPCLTHSGVLHDSGTAGPP